MSMDIDENKGGSKSGPSRGRLLILAVIVLLILGLGLSGFMFRYKTTVFSDSVLLIDRWLGDVVVLYSDGTFKRVENSSELRGPALPSQNVYRDDEAAAEAGIKWRDGRVFLHLKVKPLSSMLKKAQRDRKSKIHISLIDRDGFVIQSFEVPVYKMAPVRDEENTITSLEYRIYMPLSREEFRAIHGWKVYYRQ